MQDFYNHGAKDRNETIGNRILVVTAVEAERDAVIRGLGQSGQRVDVIAGGIGPATAGNDKDAKGNRATNLQSEPRVHVIAAGVGPATAGNDKDANGNRATNLQSGPRVDVIAGGVGPATAAASVSAALAAAGGAYAAVVSAGIGGGFAGRAEIGSLVLASEIVCADLGAEAPPQDFVSIDQLGFGTARYVADAPLTARLAEALRAAGLPFVAGPVLTVSTVTGTAESAARLAQRVPGAAAEAMEGFGVAAAAQLHGVPVAELRAVSNAVGPRDRGAWRIKEALAALEAAGAVFAEVFEHELDE